MHPDGAAFIHFGGVTRFGHGVGDCTSRAGSATSRGGVAVLGSSTAMGRPDSLNEVVSGLGGGNCKSPQGLGTVHCVRWHGALIFFFRAWVGDVTWRSFSFYFSRGYSILDASPRRWWASHGGTVAGNLQ